MPPGSGAIPCKMIFKRKLNERDHIVQYEARLLAKRYVQKQGVEYDKTLAPIVPFSVLLLVVGWFITK